MIFLSSSCLRRRFMGEIVEELGRAGVRHIELSGGTEHYAGLESDLVELQTRFGLRFLVHGYFPPPEPPEADFIVDLITPDAESRWTSMRLMARAMGLASTLGAPHYSAHPGFTVDVMPLLRGGRPDTGAILAKAEAEKIYYESVGALARTAQGLGLRLAVENMYPLEGRLDLAYMAAPEEIYRFLEYAEGRPELGLLLDLGHAGIMAGALGLDREGFVRDLLMRHGEKVFEVHLSENDGRDDLHLVNSPDSWQLRALDHVDTDRVPVVCEWRSGGEGRTVDRYFDLVKRCGGGNA